MLDASRDSAAGGEAPRAEFVSRTSRWSGVPGGPVAGIGVAPGTGRYPQEVFIECLRGGGVSTCAGRLARGIPCLLYGGARMLRSGSSAQGRQGQVAEQADFEAIASGEDSLSPSSTAPWAKAVVREAAEHQAAVAAESGEAAVRRVELLRLRFHEGMPIREIARLWGMDPAVLHHDYARAREEFLAALRDVIASHHPGSPEEVDGEWRNCSRCSNNNHLEVETRSMKRAISGVPEKSWRKRPER